MSTFPRGDEGPESAVSMAPADERHLVEALRSGDEDAFSALLERYHGSMVRLAALYVPNREVAEEVVQETWMGVLRGLDRFEARSSLKTWIFRILTNRAKTRGERESRTIPFSSVWSPDAEADEPAVEPERFRASEPYIGHWAQPPRDWRDSPEARLLSTETRSRVQQAVEGLPPSQREVITLRDVEGWSSDDVCSALKISETNQRVLLHRARSKVRRALERYFDEE